MDKFAGYVLSGAVAVVAALAFGLARLGLALVIFGAPLPSLKAIETTYRHVVSDNRGISAADHKALLAAPLSPANAAAIADDTAKYLLARNGDYGGSRSTDIEFREAFTAELVAALQSPDAPVRAAIAQYVLAPYGPAALDGFTAGQDDRAGLRRLAILAQPVAPLVAMPAYRRVDEIAPEPFVSFQLANLYAWSNDLAVARNIVVLAAQRWPDDIKAQAVAAAKDAWLDVETGEWTTWEAKYKRALALNLQAERWETAASVALELGKDRPRAYGNGDLVGADALTTIAYQRQALDLATRAKADALIAEAATALAGNAALAKSLADNAHYTTQRIDLTFAQADALRDMALAAVRRSGDVGRFYALAENAMGDAVNRGAFDRAATIGGEVLAQAEKDNDVVQVARALSLQAEIARSLKNFAAAEARMHEADGYAFFLPPFDKGSLQYHHAGLAKSQGQDAVACEYVARAGRLYRESGSPSGVAAAEQLIREWRCGR